MPDGRYDIQTIDRSCCSRFDHDTAYSSPLVCKTSAWGDICDSVSYTTPPDYVRDLVDVAAVVHKFKNLPGTQSKTRADIAPGVPDRIFDFTDIPAVVDAFQGLVYPYSGPPLANPCPW